MEFIDNVTPSGYNQYLVDLRGPSRIDDSDLGWQLRQNWATMYYQNAYNTAMTNYMNEYNSPRQQMLRYQDAGLNPFLVASQGSTGNMSSPTAGAGPNGPTLPKQSLINAQKMQATISSIQEVIGAASDLYDYIRFGRSIRQDQQDQAMYNTRFMQYRATQAGAEADWAQYWNYGEMGPNAPYVAGSPRAKYMQSSTDYKAAQIDQIQSLISTIYPNQAEQLKASAALADYKKQILESQFGVILQIDTGNNTGDAILKALTSKVLNSNWF